MQLQRVLNTVLFVLLSILVASCAAMVSYEKAVDSLRNSGVCCESIKQFRYDQLSGAEPVSIKLDSSSDAFNFQSGKSFLKAFHLPEKEKPYIIKVTSFTLGESIYKAHIFYPQVALLDDRFDIVRQSVPEDFLLSKAGTKETAFETGGVPVKLEGSFLVDNPNAKYVLVFTTKKLLDNKSMYVVMGFSPLIVPGVVGVIPTGLESVFIKHSPFGFLRIKVEPLQ